ncbi:MAG: hypothetical protein ABR929_15650, partial [Roseiarcus sp.]
GRALARASLDPCARLRLFVSMIVAERTGPAGRLRSATIMETNPPHRNDAVTAKRAKRSVAAA